MRKCPGFCKLLLLALIIVIILLILWHYEGFNANNILITLEIINNAFVRSNQLVNFTEFEYILKSNACQAINKELLATIIVTSYIGHDKLRSEHRKAISQNKLNEMGLVRVFLLAKEPNQENDINQTQIIDEYNKFQDIVQGNFIENYINLTYKHIMGLKWALMECQKADFIIKVDDDIIFNIFSLKTFLEDEKIRGKNTIAYLAGSVFANTAPIRDKSKWYVPKNEYVEDFYPDYLSGWLYITNPMTALMLTVQSQNEAFFWIDDVYVTGLLRKRLAIPLITLNWFKYTVRFVNCCIHAFENYGNDCKYFIGSNGGNIMLITDFLRTAEKCYVNKCLNRSPALSLEYACN